MKKSKADGTGTGPPRRVSLDIETFSSVDLAKAGVYRYAESPDFHVLLIGWSVDGGPVSVVDLASGEALEKEIDSFFGTLATGLTPENYAAMASGRNDTKALGNSSPMKWDLVDQEFVESALCVDRLSRAELTAELARLTEISNPNSVPQIREWLTLHGQETENLSKAEVRCMLEQAPPEIREVLLLRQQLSKTSVKKYTAMVNSFCSDGRVRGMFQFYGAARSGRWAGRLVQL